jgi:hypothetical protein
MYISRPAFPLTIMYIRRPDFTLTIK